MCFVVDTTVACTSVSHCAGLSRLLGTERLMRMAFKLLCILDTEETMSMQSTVDSFGHMFRSFGFVCFGSVSWLVMLDGHRADLHGRCGLVDYVFV